MNENEIKWLVWENVCESNKFSVGNPSIILLLDLTSVAHVKDLLEQ